MESYNVLQCKSLDTNAVVVVKCEKGEKVSNKSWCKVVGTIKKIHGFLCSIARLENTRFDDPIETARLAFTAIISVVAVEVAQNKL